MTVGRKHKTNVSMLIKSFSDADVLMNRRTAEIPASANRLGDEELNNDVIVLTHPCILCAYTAAYLSVFS